VEDGDNKSSNTDLNYLIKIETNDNNNYIIIIPIFKNWIKFEKLITIEKGDCQFSINETEYGLGLRIESNNDLTLSAQDILDGRKSFDLSLYDRENLTVYIYCKKESKNNTITINCDFSFIVKDSNEETTGMFYYINSELKNGWNVINIDVESGGG
jgi:hypothetical protein